MGTWTKIKGKFAVLKKKTKFPKAKHERKTHGKNNLIKYGSELEILTTQLIKETVDDNGELEKEFLKLIGERIKNPNIPLTEDDAKEVISNLIPIAVAQRRLLTNRIEDSIEFGNLFERYYGKLQTVDILTNNAYVKLQKMQRAESDYLYEEEVYKKVRGLAFESAVSPDDQNAGAIDVNTASIGPGIPVAENKKKRMKRMGVWEQMNYAREHNSEVEDD